MVYVRRRARTTNRKTAKKVFRKRRFNRKGISPAYRALRIARATSRKLAAEVCKFETVPSMYTSTTFNPPTSSSDTWWSFTNTSPLMKITSGQSWVMPINWVYQSPGGQNSATITVDGKVLAANTESSSQIVAKTFPIWYNTLDSVTDTNLVGGQNDAANDNLTSTQLQYRLAYIYINALFNASLGDLNPDGALRIVIVRDKQPAAGACTWYDPSIEDNRNSSNIGLSRSVFNNNRIDAQLNPKSLGRFKIMYDKTLKFNTTNAYKPWKYFKKLSNVVRNNRNLLSNQTTSEVYDYSSKYAPTPVQKNAYYLLMFSDGLDFNYTTESVTGDQSFHLMARVAYYNN